MAYYIDKSVLVAEIEKRIKTNNGCMLGLRNLEYYQGKVDALNDTLSFLNTLEVKEVDLKKLGEIARHLIAVKNNIEDMRLDKEEWLLLEKIGYPERF